MKKPNNESVSTNKKRETFSSGLAVFFATLGSAVGLGNIWKFPYLVGENGGGAFVLIYFLSILLVGMPIMVSEFYIGRKSRSNAVSAFTKLKANPKWKIIGYFGVAAAFLIMFYYSAVAGWVYSYVFKAINGAFSNLSNFSFEQATSIVENQFLTTTESLYSPVIWQGISILVVALILIGGVKNGIERITKTLMPVLFILLIISCIRALTLPGAKAGLNFLFKIDFSKINPSVILSALGLAFFKLSLGMGTMITYGSYFTEDNNLIHTSAKVALSDTFVSLLAGVAIFPVVFTFGMKPNSGPSLLFNTIPLVFSHIPFGNILIIAFFILASIAATTASLSMAEVPIAFITEKWNIKRKYSVIIVSLSTFIVGALTVHPSRILGHVTIFGKNFFDLFDYISSNIILPVGGLLIAIFVGYFVNKDSVLDELSNNHKLNNSKTITIYYFVLKYISPLLLLIVFLNSLGII